VGKIEWLRGVEFKPGKGHTAIWLTDQYEQIGMKMRDNLGEREFIPEKEVQALWSDSVRNCDTLLSVG
jgi:hypothetical protein